MKAYINLFLLLCFSLGANAQYYTVTNLSGTTTYGSTNVTVTSAGTASTTTFCGTSPYWIGAGTSGTPNPGSYTFSFSPAVNAVRVFLTDANTGESLTMAFNGVHHSITAGEVVSYSGTCGESADALSGDSLLSTVTAGAAAELNMFHTGISSATVATNGLGAGTIFTFMFSDTITSFAYSNAPICVGDTLRLFDTGGVINSSTTYYWFRPTGSGTSFTSTSQNPIIPHSTYADSGIYICVKDGGDTSLVDVVISPMPPVPTITPVVRFCSGGTLHLNAIDTAGATYSWSGPNGFTSTLQNPVINNIPTAGSGFYIVTASFGGCAAPPTHQFVQIDSTPSLQRPRASNRPFCTGDNLYLSDTSFTPSVIYSWSGPDTFSAIGRLDTLRNIQTYNSGTYTVTVSTAYCSNRDTVNVNIGDSISALVLTSNAPVCTGHFLSLSATATPSTGNWFWTGPNSFTSNSEFPSILSTVLADSGSYCVYEVVNGCISPTKCIDVQIQATPPTPLEWSNSPVCGGTVLQLYASDDSTACTFTWSGPGGYTDVGPSPSIINCTGANSGVYVVTAHLGVCTAQQVISATVIPAPTLTVSSNSPVCTGDSLKLLAGSTPGNHFRWTGPYSFSAIGGVVGRAPTISEYAGTYNVTVSDDNGCQTSGSVLVVVNNTPSPPWVNWLTYCQYNYAPPLMAIDATNILWFASDTGGPSVTVAPTPSTATPGIYFYYLNQTVHGCPSAIDSIQVIVNPKPVVSVSPVSIDVCPHTPVQYTTTDADPYDKYHWLPGYYLSDTSVASPLSNPIADIDYMLVTVNQYNCSDTERTHIGVHPSAVVNINAGDTIVLYPGQTLRFQPLSNCTSFTWFPAAGVDNSSSLDPNANPEASTQFFVTGTTQFGCVASDSVYVRVEEESAIGMPNAFTPDGAVNQYFKIARLGTATLNHFRIYNRWGALVFETNKIDDGWDGTFNGKPQPFGVYVYSVQAVSSGSGKIINKTGNLTLLR